MSRPLVVTIPHNLGRDEALRRIRDGLSGATARFASHLTVHEERWTGEHLDFHVAALKQELRGTLDVAADHVVLTMQLPWVIAVLAEKAKALITRQGRLLLEKK
jgi:hypothetical protein